MKHKEREKGGREGGSEWKRRRACNKRHGQQKDGGNVEKEDRTREWQE